MVEVRVMTRTIAYPQTKHVLGIFRSGGLRWAAPWLLKIAFGWQEVKRGMQPLKIRWGWVLLLTIALLLLMGECGPAASAQVALM
jgi:hypothetical protein